MVESAKKLEDLWKIIEKLNKEQFPENDLMPILGDGKCFKPRVMFIFINPTARNISSDPCWKGPRFPFIGVKQIWSVFHKAGLFDSQLMYRINNNCNWSLAFTKKVLEFLQRKSFYLTNIVKWTGHDSTLPDAEKIGLFLPILKKEIEIVKPEFIVTFGLIPFKALTNLDIKLSKYYEDAIKNRELKTYKTNISDKEYKIIPCYFPVGRGSPKKAVEILRIVKDYVLQG